MMDWLGSWLKEIILIILIATFVDLLLPNKSMHRYVKLVVSLFILLTILTPIVHLLRADWNNSKLTADIEMLPENRRGSGGSSKQAPSLEQIVAQGTELKVKNEQQSIPYIEQRMAEMVKTRIDQGGDDQVQEVHVNTTTAKDGTLALGNIVVVLKEEQAAPKAITTSGGVEPIKPVEIEVKIDSITDRKNNQESSAEDTVSHRSPEVLQLTKERIWKQLEPEWGIAIHQLEVRMEEKR